MRWLALFRPQARPWPEALVWWALQFTPRVTRLEEGLLLELSASLRLFGGQQNLQQRLLKELAGLLDAQVTLAWAPTAMAALALARAGTPGELLDGTRAALPTVLDALPFPLLSQLDAERELLAGLGCRRLGDVRRLPRTALARRVPAALLRQLDQAYGQAPEVHAWCEAPERFSARRELAQRQDNALALLHEAEPLLQAACLWLGARQGGCTRLRFAWSFDAFRARDLGPGGALELASSEAHRDLRRWRRLLAEHLQRVELPAPVSDLHLHIDAFEPLCPQSASLLVAEDAQHAEGESLDALLTRLSVRLGKQQVRRAEPVADHRPECRTRWQAWADAPQPAPELVLPSDPAQWPQPSWLLNPPQRLQALRDQPLYQGPLTLLAGPQRIEAGWWDETSEAARRDYYLAHNERAGLLWLYRERNGAAAQAAGSAWFLQGLLA